MPSCLQSLASCNHWLSKYWLETWQTRNRDISPLWTRTAVDAWPSSHPITLIWNLLEVSCLGHIHMWCIVMYIVSVNKCMWSKKADKCKCATFILKADSISFLFEFHFLHFSGCLQASWHFTCKQRMTPATCLWPKQSGGFQCSTNFVTHFTSGNHSPTVQKLSLCTKHL